MSIYALLPLIIIIAYIPLLVMTIGSRPWQRRHELFILFLAPAVIFGFINFILRGDFLPQYNPLLLKLILITYILVGVQFYCFVSSFFAPGERRWLPVAYATLAATTALVLLGYIPGELTFSGDRLYLDYGMEITLATVPLLALAGRGIYLFWKRLKVLDNPVLSNQIASLLLGVSVWVIFTLAVLILAMLSLPSSWATVLSGSSWWTSDLSCAGR
jgi:hypothetical protein